MFHICTADGQGGLAKYSFLCPNGTVFNQNYFICDWWFNFDCAEAEGLYSLNDDIAAERAEIDAAAAEAAAASVDQPDYSAPPSDYTAGLGLRSGRRLGNRRNNRRSSRRGGRRGQQSRRGGKRVSG